MTPTSAAAATCAPGTPVAQCQSVGASWWELGLVALLVTLILVSVVGNCLVCLAVFTDRRLRKLGNVFVVSLAIADLFVSCLVMTFALCNDLMERWIFGAWFCDLWISFDIMCCTASILNLCAISLDRFVHIKDCLLYDQWMTRRVALVGLLIVWFISALVSFVPIHLGWHRPTEAHGPSIKLEPLVGGGHQWEPSATHLAPNSSSSNNNKLDYSQEEPIEKQSSSWLEEEEEQEQEHEDEKHASRAKAAKEEAPTQFNQVESNPLDGSQIIGARHLRARPPEPPPPPEARQLAPPWPPPNQAAEAGLAAQSDQQRPAPFEPRPEAEAATRRPPDSNGQQQCVLALTPTYAVVSSAISFYIPCIIMLALYSKLFACARKHVRNIQAFTKLPAPISVPAGAGQPARPEAPATGEAGAPLPGAQEEEEEAQQQPAGGAGWRATSWLKLAARSATQTTCVAVPLLRPPSAATAAGQCLVAAPEVAQAHRHQTPSPQQQQPAQLATHKAAVTLGIIMGTFLVCWVPFFSLNIIKAFCVDCIPSSLFRAFTWLGYANSALNPIIYGIHNSEFRNAFGCIVFRHLRLGGGGPGGGFRRQPQAGNKQPAHYYAPAPDSPANQRPLSGSLQPRRNHHRKRPAATRHNSAPQHQQPSSPAPHSATSPEL